MSQIVYEETGTLKQKNTSLTPFVVVISPFSQDYGVSGVWRERRAVRDADGRLISWEAVLGNERGAHLLHDIFEITKTDGYSGNGGSEALRSYQLFHSGKGEKLELFIGISRLLYTDDEIELRFEGETGEVENLKKIVKPVLQDCLR
ncbi:MAG TPA: hypothetical protein VF599_20485 [Pyrinomonadaceae bacterium]|jgi:hypothetical protein